MSDFRTRPYRPGDEDALTAGFREVFGTEQTLDDWRWKFAPDEDGSRIVVAETEAGEIVAQYAATTVALQIDGRRVRAGHVVDSYCRRVPGSAHRRVFERTANSFFDRYGGSDEYALIVGFPGPRAARLGRVKLGYVVDPATVPFFTRLALPALRPKTVRVEDTLDPRAADELWQRSGHRYTVAAVRDGDWIRRRYLRRPGHGYHFLAAWRGDTLAAWSVFARGHDGVRWVDLVWDGVDREALLALDARAVRLAWRSRALRLTMWLAGDPDARAALAGRGWRRIESSDLPFFGMKSFSPELDAADLVDRMYFTHGDSDLV